MSCVNTESVLSLQLCLVWRSNWWRPQDDRWAGELPASDPVYVVRARKQTNSLLMSGNRHSSCHF